MRFFTDILRPALVEIAPVIDVPYSDEAARFLLAVALQESGCKYRYQVVPGSNPGPARGWWQFERGGGVHGVMNHHRSQEKARSLCEYCRVEWNKFAIHRALEGHDVLAVGFARLLLFTSPHQIPVGEARAWNEYRHNLWRPGKPHADKWPKNWATATKAVGLK